MKNKLTYRQWMTEVEALVNQETGLTFDRLPDWFSKDGYDDGLTVYEGFQMCLDRVELYEEALVDEG